MNGSTELKIIKIQNLLRAIRAGSLCRTMIVIILKAHGTWKNILVRYIFKIRNITDV